MVHKYINDTVVKTDVSEKIRKTASVIHKLDRSQSRSARGVAGAGCLELIIASD